MKDQKQFNKSKLETKVGNINDSIDSLLTKPKRVFKSKPRPKQDESSENETKPESSAESIVQFDKSEASQNLEFNDLVQYMPGTLGKDYFTITENEFKAITGSISDLKETDIHALRSLQTKLFITFQYITDNLNTVYEEEARLENHFDAVNEKIGELGSLLRSIKKAKENTEKEQIENFNKRKNLIHQHSLLNERENKVKEQEENLKRQFEELNQFRATVEDRSQAVQLQQDKLHVHRQKILKEKEDLDHLRAKILEDDRQIDEKYFEIKRQRAQHKEEYAKFKIELNTFKNIRKRSHAAREEVRKTEKSAALKKRTLNRIGQQMEFQKKAFLTGKANYQKLVDQVDHISNEIERLEQRKSELINENLKLHDEKTNITENLAVLRSISQSEMEAAVNPPSSKIRRHRPEGRA